MLYGSWSSSVRSNPCMVLSSGGRVDAGKLGPPKVNLVSEIYNTSKFDYHKLEALHVPLLYPSLALQL